MIMPDLAEFNKGVLFILGLGVFGGMLGAWLFQRLRIPQVIGYIAMGLLIGRSGFNLLTVADVEMMQPFNIFALGIIGFLVGGELRVEEFRKYGRQFAAILLGEGVLSFVLVGLSSGLVVYAIGAGTNAALAAGCIFGAIASATDPASTVDVLWENRARGRLTTSIMAIVALDDALAMFLYGLGTGAAQVLAGGAGSISAELWRIGFELLGAVVLGAAAAALLYLLLRWLHKSEKALPFALGVLLLVIATTDLLHMDVILAAMAMGFVTVNASPGRSERLFSLVRGFSGPIYVLFFVFVGARLGIGNMPGWLWLIVGLYVILRSAGKFWGAWLGARLTGSEPEIRRYIGFGLFAQGGVAVGLSIMAGRHLNAVPLAEGLSLGEAVIFGVTATTLLVQVIGPPLVRMAVRRAGEAGRNVTREDVIASLRVEQVMECGVEPLRECDNVEEVMRRFSAGEYEAYPVVRHDGNICGIVSLGSLRELLTERSAWQWLLAGDVMEKTLVYADTQMPLADALELFSEYNLENVPVVARPGDVHPAGMLRRDHVRKRVSEELVLRQGMRAQMADTAHG